VRERRANSGKQRSYIDTARVSYLCLPLLHHKSSSTMLPSPQSSPTSIRHVLDDRTNEFRDDSPIRPHAGPSSLPTPHDTPNNIGKRTADENNRVFKRARLMKRKSDVYDSDPSDEDTEMEDPMQPVVATPMQRCATNVQGMLRGLAMGNPRVRRNFICM
jgi:hypothetical protein